MVTSIAIPNATLNTKTVEGFNRTPAQPITPAVISSGTKFGMREQTNILKERNRYNMQMVINRNAQRILSFKPLMIKLLPSKKVTEDPVKVTLYLLLSKVREATVSISFSNTGNLALPMSFMFTLILAT